MRMFHGLVFVFVVTIVLTAQEANRPKVEDLGWISGCWVKHGKTSGSYDTEYWTRPAGAMLGVGRTIRQGKVRAFEYLRIEKRDQDIFYVAKPSQNKTETPFKLTSLRNKRAVFENPEHDFPQRIIYALTDAKTIAVRVEADKNGKPSGFGYSLTKVTCD